MPHVVTKTAFTLDELSVEARERAINKHIQFLIEVGSRVRERGRTLANAVVHR